MIKVAIVDDSKTARLALRRALELDSGILVVGEAATGLEAMKVIQRYNPDLVTMDVYLEEENGLDVAAWIMAELPRPVVVVTGINPSDPRLIYKALARGVLEVFPKLPAPTKRSYEPQRAELVRLVKNLATVPVLHRSKKSKKPPKGMYRSIAASPRKSTAPRKSKKPEILLVGASTGGPPVIGSLLQALPAPFPIPIVVAQHISEGFGAGFTTWLGQVSGFRTLLVERSARLEPDMVFVAPDCKHIRFSSTEYVMPTAASESDIIRPSINVLFSSGAKFFGASAIAVLMTGMGKDGAAGMKSLYDSGAFTIAQSLETCAIDSMPKTAIEMQAAESILGPEEMVKTIKRMVIK